MMSMLDATSGDACPLCRYDLRGALWPARCPECGILTGAGTRCFLASGRRRKLYLVMTAWAAGLAILLTISTSISEWRLRKVGAVAMFTVCAGHYLSRARVARAKQGASALCLTSEELAWRSGDRVERIRWSDVTGVFWSEFYETVTIRTDRMVRVIPVWLCPMEMTFREFGGLVHSWWTSHAAVRDPCVQARPRGSAAGTNECRGTGSAQPP